MIVATWNVNSVRARLDRLLAWLDRTSPDVVCLQELKVEDKGFPREALEAKGYQVVTHGQKTYNGVAILSRHPLTEVSRGFGDGVEDPQARFIAATTGGLRIQCAYVPNGESLTSEKYPYKLAWLERLRGHLAPQVGPEAGLLLCGDFNIVPEPRDCYAPELWEGEVLCSEPERQALQALLALGLTDALRALNPDRELYTWWDYRQLAFPRNHGLRIDHFLLSADVQARARRAWVDREERKGKQPSDHAPVLLELAD